MDTISFVVALVTSCLTMNGMLEQSDTFTSIVVATGVGFVFGLLAHSLT
jgi:hypothetical protein